MTIVGSQQIKVDIDKAMQHKIISDYACLRLHEIAKTHGECRSLNGFFISNGRLMGWYKWAGHKAEIDECVICDADETIKALVYMLKITDFEKASPLFVKK